MLSVLSIPPSRSGVLSSWLLHIPTIPHSSILLPIFCSCPAHHRTLLRYIPPRVSRSISISRCSHSSILLSRSPLAIPVSAASNWTISLGPITSLVIAPAAGGSTTCVYSNSNIHNFLLLVVVAFRSLTPLYPPLRLSHGEQHLYIFVSNSTGSSFLSQHIFLDCLQWAHNAEMHSNML